MGAAVFIELFGVAPADRDFRPQPAEHPCGRSSDTAAAAGYDDRLAREQIRPERNIPVRKLFIGKAKLQILGHGDALSCWISMSGNLLPRG
jgi:hypothetical protein